MIQKNLVRLSFVRLDLNLYICITLGGLESGENSPLTKLADSFINAVTFYGNDWLNL